MKHAIVKPLHKKGDNKVVSNYRPVALLPVFSKILEKIIHEKLYAFLEKNNILAVEQKGFRKDMTTNLAIYDLAVNVIESMDKSTAICVLLMDMTRAFDYVKHNILLEKLEVYGIRGVALELFRSYLSGRSQQTEISQISHKSNELTQFKSSSRPICYGVPQGSILGPLLFLIYINDFPGATKNPMILFADDCTVIIRCKDKVTYSEHINNTISDLIEWLGSNNLLINIQKTKLIHFSPRRREHTKSYYKDREIESVDQAKFLGITLDSQLNWKSHTEDLCKRVSSFAFALKKITRVSSIETAVTAYHGHVASILRYGIIFWGNSTNKDIVFKMQKQCIRAICNLKTIESCKPSYQNLKILTLPCLYIYEVAVFVKRFPHLFPTKAEVHQVNLRSRGDIYLPQSRSALFHASILHMAPKIYNKLPKNIKSMPIALFKNRLTALLCEKSYYNVEDFLNDKDI